MFGRLILALARLKGGVNCPKCGKQNPAPERAEVLACESCGYRFSLSEAMVRSSEMDTTPADPDQPPAGTRIVRSELAPDMVGWEVPPSGKSGGLLPFAVVWLVFILFFTVAALPGLFGGDEGVWMFPLFSIPFWAVGMAMLYAGLRTKYARHFLSVGPQEVIMARVLFNRTTRKSLSRRGVESVEIKEFYQKNYQPVHGVEIRGAEGKLRFGTMLSDEEKRWLIADLRRTIWPETETAKSGGAFPLTMPVSWNFHVEFPPARAHGAVWGLALGLLIVGAFLALGIFAMEDAGTFRWLWLGGNSLFAMVMIAGAITTYRNRSRVMRVSGDRGEVRVTTLREGRRIKEERLSRRGPVEARMISVGHVNNAPHVRIELLGEDKVLRVLSWYPEDAAREPFERLQAALGE